MHAHGTKVETFLLWATSLRAGRSFLPSQQRVHISNNNRHIKLLKLRTPCRYVVGYIHRMVIGWPESVLVHVEVRFLDISSLKYFEKVDELIFVNNNKNWANWQYQLLYLCVTARDERRECEVEWTCYYDVKTKNAWSSGEMWKSSERVNVPSAHAFTQNIFGVLIASIKAWFNDGQSYDTVSFFLSELWRWDIGCL